MIPALALGYLDPPHPHLSKKQSPKECAPLKTFSPKKGWPPAHPQKLLTHKGSATRPVRPDSFVKLAVVRIIGTCQSRILWFGRSTVATYTSGSFKSRSKNILRRILARSCKSPAETRMNLLGRFKQAAPFLVVCRSSSEIACRTYAPLSIIWYGARACRGERAR